MNIETLVRKYILENFMYTDDQAQLTMDMSLIDNGIIDSTGALELVAFIEETFGVQVNDTELVPSNFDSLGNLTLYIQHKLQNS